MHSPRETKGFFTGSCKWLSLNQDQVHSAIGILHSIPVCQERRDDLPQKWNDLMSEPRYWQEDGADHIDVRGMEPPGPFVTILRWIEGPECRGEVVVHLSRDPVYLFPELTERNWRWDYLTEASDEVVLRLTANED